MLFSELPDHEEFYYRPHGNDTAILSVLIKLPQVIRYFDSIDDCWIDANAMHYEDNSIWFRWICPDEEVRLVKEPMLFEHLAPGEFFTKWNRPLARLHMKTEEFLKDGVNHYFNSVIVDTDIKSGERARRFEPNDYVVLVTY